MNRSIWVRSHASTIIHRVRLALTCQSHHGLCIFLHLFPIHQICFDTSQIFPRLAHEVSRLGAAADIVKHLADLGFAVDVRTDTSNAVMCQAAEIAIFDTGNFKRTVPDWMSTKGIVASKTR